MEDEDGEAMEMPKVDMDSIFSLRRPRDAIAGLSSGLKSIVKGTALGVSALVVAPVAGAATRGVSGFCLGLFGGVLGAAIIPCVGSVIGTVQIVRGLVYTPAAMVNAVRGQHWDQNERSWVEWNPHRALVLETNAPEAIEDPSAVPEVDLESDDYYVVLGVRRDCTPEELRRQYFSLARDNHPDKNPGDEQAKVRFQNVSKAYQVLSDPSKREAYDAHGRDAVDSMADGVDPALVFTMLFGSDSFADYVGELMVATVARVRTGPDSIAMQRSQLSRLITLTHKLIERTSLYDPANPGGFAESMRTAAKKLAQASYGNVMLATIATAYRSSAEQARGGFKGMRAKASASLRAFKQQMAMLKSATSILEAHQRMESLDEQEAKAEAAGAQAGSVTGEDTHNASSANMIPEQSSSNGAREDTPDAARPQPTPTTAATDAERARKAAEKANLEQEAMPMFIEAMWAANVIDIEKMLGRVCALALYGNNAYGFPPVDTPTRRSRIAALCVIADVFAAEAEGSSKAQRLTSANDAMQRAVEAAARRKAGLDDLDEQTAEA